MKYFLFTLYKTASFGVNSDIGFKRIKFAYLEQYNYTLQISSVYSSALTFLFYWREKITLEENSLLYIPISIV